MANTGDYYDIPLGKAHMDWGEHRYTGSRNPIPGEAYLPLPQQYAKMYNIVNSNSTGGADILGQNLFKFHTRDGFLSGYLKAQGDHKAGDIYAKQFSVQGNLKVLGTWYDHIHATSDTTIHVEWISSDEIELSEI